MLSALLLISRSGDAFLRAGGFKAQEQTNEHGPYYGARVRCATAGGAGEWRLSAGADFDGADCGKDGS